MGGFLFWLVYNLLVFRLFTIIFVLFLTALPLEAVLTFEVGFTIRLSYILLTFSLLLLAYRHFVSRRKIEFASKLDTAIFLSLGASVISLMMNFISSPPEVEFNNLIAQRSSEFRSIIQLALLFFFASSYFLTIHFCSNQSNLNTALKTYILTAFVVSLYGVYQFFAITLNLPFVDITNAINTAATGFGAMFYKTPDLFRPHGTFQEPLNLGHYILSVLPMLLVFHSYKDVLKQQIISKFFLIKFLPVTIFVMSFALFLTKSKGAWLGFVVSIIPILLLTKIKYGLRIIALLLPITLTIWLVLFVVSPEAYKSIPANRFSPDAARSAIYDFEGQLFKEFPILGVGIGNFGKYAAEYFGSPLLISAHGVFQSSLTETGLLGFAALLYLIFTYYKVVLSALQKSRGTELFPYMLGFMGSFTAMAAQYFTFGDRFNLYFWVFLGISMATAKIIENKYNSV